MGNEELSKKDFEELKELTGNKFGELKAAVEKRDNELKKIYDEGRKASDEEIKKLNKLYTEMKTAMDDYKKSYEELKKAADEMALKVNRTELNGIQRDEVKSIGGQFVEEFDKFMKPGGRSARVKDFGHQFTKSLVAMFREMKEFSGISSADQTAIGAFGSERVPGIIAKPTRPAVLRDLIPVQRTTSNTIEFVQETGFHRLATQLTATANQNATTITVENANGFYSGQTIHIGTEDSHSDSTIAEDGVNTTTNVITLTSGLSAQKVSGTHVYADDFTFTAETELKPVSEIDLEIVSASIKTLASGIPLPKTVLDDNTQLEAHINQRLLDALMISEENEILYGDGTGQHLQGIMTHADVLTFAWSAGSSGDTRMDAIRRGITLAALQGYQVTGIVMHPSDWQEIEISKDDEHRYLWVNVTMGGEARLWRLPVVVTTAIHQGDVLVGAFQDCASIWDREVGSVAVFDQHKDFAQRNMVYVRAEERIGLTIYRPEGFVVVTLDEAPDGGQS